MIAVLIFFILIVGMSTFSFIQRENTPGKPAPVKEEVQENTNTDSNLTNETPDTIEEEPNNPADLLTRNLSERVKEIMKYFSNKKWKVVAIGDSLTQGVGDETGQGGYVGILNSYLNQDRLVATFKNYGKRGNRTDQLFVRMKEPDIRQSLKEADIILITIGANDIMQVLKENFTDITYQAFAEERSHYETRLRDILSDLTDLNPNASIYLIGFYNPFQQYFDRIEELDMIVDDWNNTSKFVAEDYGATFIPTKDLFMNQEVNLFAEDHFHPNHNGYQLIADRILDYFVMD